MALRISKITKEIKCFKLLKKMFNKGYVYIESKNICNNTYSKINFPAGPAYERRICEIHIDENDLVTFVKSVNGNVLVEKFETLIEALVTAEEFIWDVLPKRMLEDVLEIGSYNV